MYLYSAQCVKLRLDFFMINREKTSFGLHRVSIKLKYKLEYKEISTEQFSD